MSTNTTRSKLPTHKNLRDRIAALQQLNQQNNSSSTSPNLSATSSFPDPSLTATQSNANSSNNTKGSLRDKIARFEAAGGTPIPRGSFGMGAMPSHDDDISRRKGEMLGNRVPGLNRPKALPTEGLGMASKSHLTVKPVAKDSTHHHSRGESQSYGGRHRRFTSQSSYSALTSPSLSAYEGEGGAGLSDVDEFGGLNGSPQTLYSPYSPTSTFSSLPSPEVTAIDKLPGKVVIPNKFQRRVVSDYQANYGFTRALTPDPDMALQPLEEEVSLSPANCGSRSGPEESIPSPQTYDASKELEIQSPTEPTLELQAFIHETHLPPHPLDSSREAAMETALGPTSVPIPVVGVIEEGEVEGNQRPSDMVLPTQDQHHDPVPEVSMPNPISIPLSSVMGGADVSPPASSKVSTPSTPEPIAGAPHVIASAIVEELVPLAKVAQGFGDASIPGETPALPTLALPLPQVGASLVDGASSQLQTPPESPKPASSISTAASDPSDSTIDYQSGSNHLDPDHDLFVLPLPKDDELPPQPIVQEVAVPRSMHQVLASLPTLQPPISPPITAAGSVSTESSDPNISFTGDESLALDASQAEIVIAQSEVISPASPTILVAMPSPPPTATTFRTQTPPPSEEPLPPIGEVDNARASPPRIRKKLYTNHSAPTSFKDASSPPPTQQSFSAVVHQKTTSTYVIPPDRMDSLTPKPSKPMNAFMTPRKKQSLFTEPMTPASPGSELAFLVRNAAVLEAQLEHGGGSGNKGLDKPNPAKQSAPLPTEPPPQSTLRLEITKVKSASTPALVPSSVTTPSYVLPVPDFVYDDGSSLNFGLPSNPQIPSFLPQLRSRKSGTQEEADRKSLAPSHKSRKSEKSAKEKEKDSMPRTRKLSSRLRSLASASTNSLRSLGRPSVSSETSVSFESPATVSIEPMTPQDTGGENGRLGFGIGSPGIRSQTSQGSGSEWDSPPRKRDVFGRASSFADRLLSRAGRNKSGFLDNSQDSASNDYLSPMRTSTVSGRNASRESQRGTSTRGKYGITDPRTTSPPRVEIPFFRDEDTARTPLNNSSDYLSTSLKILPPIPLTPSTPDSSSFLDTTELFDAFPSVPQNLPSAPGTSLLSGFELRTNSGLGLAGGLGKAATISSDYRRTSHSYR
ncbi:hypothetical protein BDM02DRAFT_314786 [Thelephora ganbajun]|uniref:Uncharacterized protein n=1 Tax=Thelephora ganbajun TaxID=370292 RepID=A0ACB6Z8Z6_THEGA|nr:hypothetical protein BDM02DRAFT_314786 [Thelephora ganbajun]